MSWVCGVRASSAESEEEGVSQEWPRRLQATLFASGAQGTHAKLLVKRKGCRVLLATLGVVFVQQARGCGVCDNIGNYMQLSPTG